MITTKISESDTFLEMPFTTQCLYFHLNMRADDDGFVGNPKKIMEAIGTSEDDLKLLIAKKFVLTFENGVIVIKNWRMHKVILQNYKEDIQGVIYETSKRNLHSDKDAVISVSKDSVCQEDIRQVLEEWNSLSKFGIKQISRLNKSSNRYKMLIARIKQYGKNDVLAAIEKIKKSDYCQGKNKYGWTITFDWFIRPNNFPKVFDGNYDNRKGGTANEQPDGGAKTYNDRILPGREYNSYPDDSLFK